MHFSRGPASRAGTAQAEDTAFIEVSDGSNKGRSVPERGSLTGLWTVTSPRAVPGIIDAVVTQPYQDCRLAGAYQLGNEMPASSLQSWVGLITSFAPTGPSRVLDVGAGTGMFAAHVWRIRRGREE